MAGVLKRKNTEINYPAKKQLTVMTSMFKVQNVAVQISHVRKF